MSRRFPNVVFEANQPIDPDRIMRAGRSFYEEMSNKLNEHNFHARAFDDPEQFDHDAVYNWYTTKEIAPVQSMVPPGDNSLAFSVRDQWQPMDLELTMTTQGAWFMVMASFQVELTTPSVGSANLSALFALTKQGNILLDSIIGTVEEDQDIPTTGFSADAVLGGGLGWLNVRQSAPVVRKIGHYINLNWVGYLPEGQHTFRIECKLLSAAIGIPDSTGEVYIGSRELTALEIKK